MTLDALRAASEHTIRAILIALCDDSDISEKALSYLSMLEPDAVKRAKDSPTTEKKRKATSGLAICVQCEISFDPDDNNVKECQYHNGELEPDYESDVWAGHDEMCHGTIDSDFCRNECPEGFVWTCCDKRGDEEGCKLGRHEADPERNKRRRDDDDQSEDEDEGDGSQDDEEEEEEE